MHTHGVCSDFKDQTVVKWLLNKILYLEKFYTFIHPHFLSLSFVSCFDIVLERIGFVAAIIRKWVRERNEWNLNGNKKAFVINRKVK